MIAGLIGPELAHHLELVDAAIGVALVLALSWLAARRRRLRLADPD